MTEIPSDHEGIPDSASWGEIEYHLGKLSVIGTIDSTESEAVIKDKDTARALDLLFWGALDKVPNKNEKADFRAVIDFLIKVGFLNPNSNPEDYE